MKKFFILILSVCIETGVCQTTKSKEEISKQFLEDLKQDQLESALKFCDTTLTNKLDSEKLRNIWGVVNEQCGGFKDFMGIETKANVTYQTFKFEKITFDFQIAFNSQNLITGFFIIPYVPKNTYQLAPYVKLEMFFEQKVNIKTGNCTLPGILTIPRTGDKFPIVILVHGSGPNDKDESIGNNKPFKDLADGLGSKGIAVLRYDKRTKVYSNKSKEDINKLTVKDEYLDDVSSAIRLVKGRKEIDRNNIYVIGHSQGGMLAPRIAKLNSDLKGIVMMAAPAGRFEASLIDQLIHISEGNLSDEEKREMDAMKAKIEKVKHNDFSKNSAENLFGLPESYWRDLNHYHQIDVAKKLDCKILVLQGERDYQVPLKEFDVWKKELSTKKNVECHSYPKLNHLFLEGEGISMPAEYDVPGNIPEYVIDDLVKWIIN